MVTPANACSGAASSLDCGSGPTSERAGRSAPSAGADRVITDGLSANVATGPTARTLPSTGSSISTTSPLAMIWGWSRASSLVPHISNGRSFCERNCGSSSAQVCARMRSQSMSSHAWASSAVAKNGAWAKRSSSSVPFETDGTEQGERLVRLLRREVDPAAVLRAEAERVPARGHPAARRGVRAGAAAGRGRSALRVARGRCRSSRPGSCPARATCRRADLARSSRGRRARRGCR